MKKIVLLFVTLATTLVLASCDGESIAVCNHEWSGANCDKPKTCTVCGKTEGEALGHTTESGTCDRCGESFSKWELGEYVDEFNMPTGKKYIGIDSTGTFSNSATSNSALKAYLQIDNNNIGIMLWEYGRNLVKGTFDYEDYNITVLDTNAVRHYFTGTIYKSGTRIYIEDSDINEFINILKQNGNIKIYLKSTKYSISTYLFEIDAKGFAESYSEIN